MKKIELHLHLDGSLNIQCASNLMKRDVTDELVSKHAKTLSEYLDKFKLPIELLKTKENIIMFSSLLAKDLEKDEVIYAEIRFCPLLHSQNVKPSLVIESVIEGLNKVPNVKTNLILCMMRNFSFEKNIEIIELAEKFLGKGVCAIEFFTGNENY